MYYQNVTFILAMTLQIQHKYNFSLDELNFFYSIWTKPLKLNFMLMCLQSEFN